MAEQDQAAAEAKQTSPPAQTVTKKEIEDNKLNAILCYLSLLIIVPLVDEKAKKSPYVKFHINQGLVLLIAAVILFPVHFILAFIPFLGWLISFILAVGLFVIWLMGILSAVNGEMKRLPIIGNFEIFK